MKIKHQQFKEVKLLGDKLAMTLVELLLVVVIVGVLATLVLPSFQSHILKSRRNDGITQLLRLKLQQEVFRTKHPSYASSKDLAFPKSEYFIFTASNESATTYKLTATAKGSQVNDKACKSMSIDQSMLKQPTECF